MSKHTPGPWHFDEDSVFTNAKVENDGDVVCFMPDPDQYECSAVHWPANRRLIAAAPELLAACHAVLMLRSLGGMMRGVRDVVMVAVEEAEKAIQKATGEEPKC